MSANNRPSHLEIATNYKIWQEYIDPRGLVEGCMDCTIKYQKPIDK